MTDPAKFENISSFIFQDAELFLSKMIKEMTWKKYHERVLDYGCGAGKTGFNQILPQVYLHDSHLYSVDISEDMVAYASMKYPHSCVTYAIGDIMSENYPFKYIKFDKIFCTFVLEFIKDYENALKRFYEGLNQGGQFGFTIITNYYCYVLYEKLGRSERWGKFMEDYAHYIPEIYEQQQNSIQAFEKCLKGIGFEIVTLETHELKWKFENEESAVEFFLATSPFTKNIPTVLQEEYKKDCLQALAETSFSMDPGYATDDKSFEMKYEVLYGFVKKSGAPILDKVTKISKHKARFSLP